jgi:DNA-binding XRE family transcriptional regulator
MTRAELKKARSRLNMTQGELAEALGLARNSIVRMENGSQPILRTTELAVKYLVFRMSKNQGKK